MGVRGQTLDPPAEVGEGGDQTGDLRGAGALLAGKLVEAVGRYLARRRELGDARPHRFDRHRFDGGAGGVGAQLVDCRAGRDRQEEEGGSDQERLGHVGFTLRR
ncbi:MAG: hypothetical protein COZ96_08110 [Nitrospirae bacterium CG_4_8_14_3_um_filter_70_85]|nr:MAG: hypothetical protein COS73_09200 [Nitrospirae bacterium CG06_land_8_20_14_3_00_70_43]PIW82565.1 MAG: hypothetical protein COZ96_08110 [Nitrospirae bacterium CG_4_8_14_3_um_filter_70_85]PIX83784.1 MAG: hypothetical protein COZ33_03535 [Nitrospirae bacterium CG_4_10_14_3_um_filter_70_108]PJB95918.1 MAG: hypothetical protein CO080_05260 [Nitrospirae bacterium CG_4_9_14_0_8_um_filter_70_14]HBB39871.1 hypothetical protein [Pseudomonadota bacterium]